MFAHLDAAGVPFTARRQAFAWGLAVVGPVLLALAFVPARDDDGLPGALPAFVLVVIVCAVVGGTAPALVASVWGFLAGNSLLTRPYGTLHIDQHSSVVGLVSYAIVGVAIAAVGGRLARRTAEAQRTGALDEIDRFRTALLRAVSHDLRTPLASIKAAASSLQQDDVDWPAEARDEFLATIVEEGDRLDRIVANLLNASRLDAGVLPVSLRPVQLDDLVPHVLHTMAAPSTVQTSIDPLTPAVRADAELLERVLENLVVNASRFSPAAVEISVSGPPRPSQSGDVTLRIVDHGPGVPAAEQATMFEAFQRLGDDAAGVGLGLAVARGFVEAMGGRLSPSTTPGGGLTMDITLPAMNGAA